jgi:hypothetical protein
MMRQIPLKNTSNTLPELGFITSAYVLRFQLLYFDRQVKLRHQLFR